MTILLACRGCCCGTGKHPDVDHDTQLSALADAIGDDGLEITPCLGPCRWSNVYVAVEAELDRQVWFGKVLDPADTAALATWLRDSDRWPVPQHLVRFPPSPDRARALQIASYRSPRIPR